MTRTASSVGMSEANAPKHLKAGSVEGLRAALSDYDAAAAACPFARQPTPPKFKPCPKCGAESNEGCREEIRAAVKFITSARLSLTLEGEG